MARATKSAPVSNVFGGAPILAPVAPKKGAAFEQHFKGVERHAALTALKKLIEGHLAAAEATLKADALEEFIATGVKLGRRPENIKGEEGIGSASIQLKISTSALSDDAIADFELHGITVDTDTQIADTFIFNPAYASDAKKMEEIEKKLGGHLLELADDRGPIIQRQIGKAKTRVGEVGMNEIFAKDEALVRELLPQASSLAVLSKLKDGNVDKALDLLRDLFETEKSRKAEAAATAEPTKKKKVA